MPAKHGTRLGNIHHRRSAKLFRRIDERRSGNVGAVLKSALFERNSSPMMCGPAVYSAKREGLIAPHTILRQTSNAPRYLPPGLNSGGLANSHVHDRDAYLRKDIR